MPFDWLSAGAVCAAPDYRRRPDGSPQYYHRRDAARLRAEAFARVIGGVVRKLTGTVLTWRERARARRVLVAMDDRMRRDIGLSQFHVLRESTKPFWRA